MRYINGKLIARAEQFAFLDRVPVDIYGIAVLMEGQHHQHAQTIRAIDSLCITQQRSHLLARSVFIRACNDIREADMTADGQHNIFILCTKLFPNIRTVQAIFDICTGIIQIFVVEVGSIPVHKRMCRDDNIFIRICLDNAVSPSDCRLIGCPAKRQDEILSFTDSHFPIIAVQFFLSQHLVLVRAAEVVSTCKTLIGECLVKAIGIIVIASHRHPRNVLIAVKDVHCVFTVIPLGAISRIDHIAHVHHSADVIGLLIVHNPLR